MRFINESWDFRGIWSFDTGFEYIILDLPRLTHGSRTDRFQKIKKVMRIWIDLKNIVWDELTIPNHHRHLALILSTAPLVLSSITAAHSASSCSRTATRRWCRSADIVLSNELGTASVPVPFRGATSSFQGHFRLSLSVMTNPTISVIGSDDDNDAAISSFVSCGVCHSLISRLLFVHFPHFWSFSLNSNTAAVSDFAVSSTIVVLLHLNEFFPSRFTCFADAFWSALLSDVWPLRDCNTDQWRRPQCSSHLLDVRIIVLCYSPLWFFCFFKLSIWAVFKFTSFMLLTCHHVNNSTSYQPNHTNTITII